jgi:hypothetical protein
MRPSDVNLLDSVPPLVGTLHKSEREAAATLIVRCCVLNGDTWRPCKPEEIGHAIQHDLDGKIEPLHGLRNNPFWNPDFHALVAGGFARWLGDPKAKGCPIELTPLGIDAIGRGR